MKLYRLYDSIVLEYSSSAITTISAFSFNAIKRSSTYVFRSQKNPISQRIDISEIKKKNGSDYTEIELDELISTKFGLFDDVSSGSTSFDSITGVYSDNTSLNDKFIEVETLISDLETEVSGKANSSHTHTQSEIIGLVSALTTINSNVSGLQSLVDSDDVNLDTVQELVDALKDIQTYLDTILVNDLITGGVSKALTAQQGVVLKGLIDAINSTLNDFFTVDYINDLNSKQDNLISGTNLKTFEGVSLLGSGNLSLLNENKVFLFNDFMSATALQPFVGGAISTGTIAQNTTNFSVNTLGVCRITKSTTANSGYRAVTDSNSLRLKGGEVYSVRFSPLNVTTQTLRGGFIDATTVTESVDGVYFEIKNNGNLILKTSSNSVRSSSPVLATLVVNTWYKIEVIIGAGATSAYMNLYNATGTLIGSTTPITTNIPTGVGRETGCGFVSTGSSATADALLDIDFHYFKQTLTR